MEDDEDDDFYAPEEPTISNGANQSLNASLQSGAGVNAIEEEEEGEEVEEEESDSVRLKTRFPS